MEQQYSYRITDFASSERPRERLEKLGPQALTNAELLAILLRVGIRGENAVQLGQHLLQDFGGLKGLHQASFLEICHKKGVGKAKAAQVKAAIELGRRLSTELPEDRPVIGGPADVAGLVMYEMSAFHQENLWVLIMDTKNHLIKIDRLYQGSLNSSLVRVGELFKIAIQSSAASIIMVHNHPSGDPSPSNEDVHLTKAVIQAGKLLDITLLDHLVIGSNRYVSLKDKRLGFE